MTRRNLLYPLLLLILGALFATAPFALGSPDAPLQDATDQAATVNALVEERFQQTLQANAPVQTATAEAMLTATIDAQATGTAGFQLTVDAAFAQALTATAQGGALEPLSNVQATAVPTDSLEGAAGLRVTLRAEGDNITDRRMERVVSILERRLNGLGIPATVTRENRRIIVVMGASDDPNEAIAAIQGTGLLEFVDMTGLGGQIGELVGQTLATTEVPDRLGGVLNPLTNEPFETILTGADVTGAQVMNYNDSEWVVSVGFSDDASAEMVAFSGSHVNEPLAIVLDGRAVSIPIIQGEFGAGGAQINGGFSEADANRLALQLSFGSLPLDLTVLSVERLGEAPTVQTTPRDVPPAETDAPDASATPGPSPTFDPRPTVTTGQIQIVEQVFEHGRMFYIQPLDQIWVMVITDEGRGEWTIYPDTFEEGDPEFDPSLVPPDELYQPERGFGKLWRDNEEVREALGWGTTPEFGYISNYQYVPGGEMVNGQFVPGPGYHVLFSLYGEAFRFNEADNTWELNQDE